MSEPQNGARRNHIIGRSARPAGPRKSWAIEIYKRILNYRTQNRLRREYRAASTMEVTIILLDLPGDKYEISLPFHAMMDYHSRLRRRAAIRESVALLLLRKLGNCLPKVFSSRTLGTTLSLG